MAIMTIQYNPNMNEYKDIACSYTRGTAIRKKVVKNLNLKAKIGSDFQRKFAVKDVYINRSPDTEVEILETGEVIIQSAKGSKRDINQTKSKLLGMVEGLELN